MTSPPTLRPFSRRNELLLHAALAEGDGAIAAWTDWLAEAEGLDQLEAGEFRMLPLVYRNLRVAGYDDSSALGRLNGIYRQTWYRNRIAEQRLREAVGALTEAGIESMVLKGMALVAIAYREPGLRPMNDLDLLIHGRELRRATGVLEGLGWQFAQGRPQEMLEFARLFHAVLFRHESGIELDLHRHMLEESNWPGADAGLWERRITASVGDLQVGTLAPEDHLVHVIVHGARWDPIATLRWVADATLLIRAHDIDWERVTTEANKRGVSLSVAAGMLYLRDTFAAPVPDSAFNALAAGRPSLLERIDFRAQQAGDGAIPQMLRYTTRYLRLTSRRGIAGRVRSFPLYLRAMWGLDSAWQAPKDGLRRVWLRARGIEPKSVSQRYDVP